MNVAENRSERSHAHGRRHRCRHNSHKTANVLNALPKSAHPGAKAALAEIYNAEDAEHARTAVTTFEADFGAKWPKAVAKITEDLDVLLEFYTYPAEHWVHLRTTNPIESHFRHRSAAATHHQRARFPRRWRGDGIQARRVSTAALARGQRTSSGAARASRCSVREGQTRRTTRRPERRTASRMTRRSTGLDYSSLVGDATDWGGVRDLMCHRVTGLRQVLCMGRSRQP